jgi:hypothetical protein
MTRQTLETALANLRPRQSYLANGTEMTRRNHASGYPVDTELYVRQMQELEAISAAISEIEAALRETPK